MSGVEVKYRKKGLIVVKEFLKNGGVVVYNEGNTVDKWIISQDVFEKTYERVVNDGKHVDKTSERRGN